MSKTWNGDAFFAMVPTLSREKNLETIPIIDLLIVDEAHHATANTYLKIVNHVIRINKDVKIFGLTATPNRADEVGLGHVFNNICDEISIVELIASGHLVKPRFFRIDTGVDVAMTKILEKNLKKSLSNDHASIDEVASILNTSAVNKAVIQHWKEKGDGRQTVVFCSSVEHGRSVTKAFEDEGISSVFITGDITGKNREKIYDEYNSGRAKVIVNVAVLVEGWDQPLTSCVILLRPCMFKTTMTQMVGRGLRTVCNKKHPGVVKKDCVVLDFGLSSAKHGTLLEEANLHSEGKEKEKEGPESDSKYDKYDKPKELSKDVTFLMTEIEMMEYHLPRRRFEPLPDFKKLTSQSGYFWQELTFPGREDVFCCIAIGFNAWSGIFLDRKGGNGDWIAICCTTVGREETFEDIVNSFKQIEEEYYNTNTTESKEEIERRQKKQLELSMFRTSVFEATIKITNIVQILGRGDEKICMAFASDHINVNGKSRYHLKGSEWLYLRITERQIKALRMYKKQYDIDYTFPRGKASTILRLRDFKDEIEKLLNL